MTREEILEMPAGRLLNLLVAEKVFSLIAWEEKRGEYLHVTFQDPKEREPYMRNQNWKKDMERYRKIDYSEISINKHVVHGVKDYSTDMSAAWEVVEKYDLNKFNLNYLDEISFYGKGWHCKIEEEHSHQCQSAPESICKAALLTVLEESL